MFTFFAFLRFINALFHTSFEMIIPFPLLNLEFILMSIRMLNSKMIKQTENVLSAQMNYNKIIIIQRYNKICQL